MTFISSPAGARYVVMTQGKVVATLQIFVNCFLIIFLLKFDGSLWQGSVNKLIVAKIIDESVKICLETWQICVWMEALG